MRIFPFESEVIEQHHLEDLISAQTEESINLEFKAADSLTKKDPEKNEISKDVSAFANSGGGTIIYGIMEKNHRADSLSPIDGDEYNKEWLEQVINSRIQRRIDGIKIVPVRVGGAIGKTIYVVGIPESDNAPHSAHDKKYYKRNNFMSIPMEEYEVRNLYARKSKTILRIGQTLIANGASTTQPFGSFRKLLSGTYVVRFQVENLGMTIENQYKLEMWVPTRTHSVTENPELSNLKIRNEGEYAVYSVPNQSPLFQGETTTAATLRVVIDRHSFQLLSVSPILLKLYYSNGIDEIQPDLTKMLSYEGALLTEDAFI
jgi:hypothetical protein